MGKGQSRVSDATVGHEQNYQGSRPSSVSVSDCGYRPVLRAVAAHGAVFLLPAYDVFGLLLWAQARDTHGLCLSHRRRRALRLSWDQIQHVIGISPTLPAGKLAMMKARAPSVLMTLRDFLSKQFIDVIEWVEPESRNSRLPLSHAGPRNLKWRKAHGARFANGRICE